MSYEVAPGSPALHDQIVHLQTHLWSSDLALNSAYLRWKYADNPYLREGVLRVALYEGRVVAMRGLFGALWESGDGAPPRLLPYADDLVVAPAHRNTGIARRVLEALLEDGARCGFPFALSLSAGPVTFVISLASGWRAAGPYRSVRRDRPAPPRWLRRLNRLRRRYSPALFGRFDRHIGRGGGPLSAARIARPDEMAALIRRLPWDGRIRHVRDARYLDWRFRNPMHEYRFLYWDEGGLQGYLVLQRYRSERADRRRVNIVDWEAGDERVRAGLLARALAWGGFERVHVWTAGASEPVCSLLHEHGFVAEEEPAVGVRARSSGLLVRRLAAAPEVEPWLLGRRNLLDLADWDLRMLYSMTG